MTRSTVVTARRLKTVVGVFLALAASACATSRPSGSPQPAPAPAATTAAGSSRPATAGAASTPATPARRIATAKDGTKLAYDMTGSGPFLVMLHGGGQAARSWADRDYVTKLKDKFTLVTPDQRGIGGSDKPATLEAYALDLSLIHI